MSSQLRTRAVSRRDGPEVSGPWSILAIADAFVERRSSTTTRLGMPFVVSEIDDLLLATERMTGTVVNVVGQFWQTYVSSTDSGISYSGPPRSVRDEVQELRDDIARRTRLTRQQISRALGVDRRSLSAWVKGVATPGTDKLERLHMLAGVVRDIDATGPGRATEVLLSRAGGQDLLDHIAAGHFRRAGDWQLLQGAAPAVTIVRRRPARRPLHQNALEAYLRGELRPLGRAATLRPESDYEQDLAEAERLLPSEPARRRTRRGYQ